MELQQIMEMLVEMRADIRTSQAKVDAHQAKMDALPEGDDDRNESLAENDDVLSWKDGGQGFEGNPKEMESETEPPEVPKENAIVKPVGGKKRHRGQNLATEHSYETLMSADYSHITKNENAAHSPALAPLILHVHFWSITKYCIYF
jgi:hypothetical protein